MVWYVPEKITTRTIKADILVYQDSFNFSHMNNAAVNLCKSGPEPLKQNSM